MSASASARIAPSVHRVQFYEDDAFLVGAVAAFLADGLRGDGAAVMIVTPPHGAAFLADLAARGIDLDEAKRSGRLRVMDAEETLASFLVDGRPDRSRFAAVAELEETVRFSEMFNGILGHDLRNPLAAILTAAQMMVMRDETESQRKPLSRILSSGQRMAVMIEQLLDFTRIRSGKGIPIRATRTDLLPILQHVMDELDDANPEWTLSLECEGSDLEGEWDADRLSQVFSNLIANGIQHGIAAGGIRVHVDARAPETVRVEIRNRGAIPPEVFRTLFQPMARSVASTKNRAVGLGLGLFITQEIARAHGGRVEARSDAGDTTFAVILPRAAATR